MIKIALLGFGTVGKGTYEILNKNRENIKKIVSDDVVVTKILKRNLNFETDLDKKLFTDNFEDIINDEEILLIVEMTGDLENSYMYIKRAIENKKNVVTANKAVVSEYFEEFTELAKKNNVAFLYESSVAASLPIITPLKSQSVINDIYRVRGILNGTSNFLLSNMELENKDYSDVLKQAQDLGYAEAEPFDDVEGIDALRKLRILSTIAFKSPIKNENILHYGIGSISKVDIEYFKNNNLRVKLVAESKLDDKGYTSIVEPVILSRDDSLFNINDTNNIVEIFGDNYDSLSVAGQGAGSFQTGNAVVIDIIDALCKNYIDLEFNRDLKNMSENMEGIYYLRISNKFSIDDSLIDNLNNMGENIVIKTKKIKRNILFEQLKNIPEKEYFVGRYEIN
ncbi:homoserine dehydrogenase [Peptoniphilus sp. oral taxon 386]|uniref:homoserine dehydrogenase n=1 Tax=Peptoniphilus sp. oral taxon 386 TaxID=652713 RepID=UPI0001DA9AD5|nr:homoserine dehydrogenase [Peptoniphilus sp. oral taxon 386]EFI42031.1 homoserine dehydrogenase [Peptoniphilus sp. oral taxon 386 str. F0131]